jgi:hypothetical protein
MVFLAVSRPKKAAIIVMKPRISPKMSITARKKAKRKSALTSHCNCSRGDVNILKS